MTVAKKLLLAATIVAAGSCVAFLLGRPNSSSVSQVALHAGESHNGSPRATVAAPRFDTWSSTSLPLSSARLVPDPQGEAASHFRLRESSSETEAPVPITEPVQHATAANTPHIEPVHVPELFTLAPEAQPIPRAKLLNEAPRPIATGSRSTPALQGLSSPWTTDQQYHQAAAPAIGREASRDVMPARFTSAAGSPNGQPNAQAGVSAPTISATIRPAPLAPLPFTSSPEVDAPRSHIIVDGDSLARLAGRYLDDPHRATEIYELNRHVLTSPELLPIGVELEIPSRSAVTTAATTSPQSSMQRTVAIHAPAASGLVPIRPVPRATGMPPRAYLAAPRRPE